MSTASPFKLSPFEMEPAVSLDALSPFRRGANAPLAGRTILQIVPPLAAGGDERATLAVTAALAETGARALVATNSGELAGELQAIGGLFVRFPAATKNPLHDGAQHATSAAHHRFGAGRSRPRSLALGRVDGGQGLPQGEAPAGHLASGRWCPHAPALQLRDRRRRGRHCYRVVRICRRACGNALPAPPQAPQDRSSGNGSLKTSAGTGERAPRVRRSFGLGRRGA